MENHFCNICNKKYISYQNLYQYNKKVRRVNTICYNNNRDNNDNNYDNHVNNCDNNNNNCDNNDNNRDNNYVIYIKKSSIYYKNIILL